jgi:hypothetical protein
VTPTRKAVHRDEGAWRAPLTKDFAIFLWEFR